MSKVFVNGCFDLLHKGHLSFLKEAKKQGDYLIVGLNSDISIKKFKDKSRPIENQETRGKKLLETGLVNEVIIYDEETPIELIRKINPDVIVRGFDQKIEPELREFKFVRLKRFGNISTTKIIASLSSSAGRVRVP